VALRVALGQYDTGWHDPAGSLARATTLVRAAKAEGAELVVLPEMCTSGFVMNPARYAEPIDGPSITTLRQLARESSIGLVAGVATRVALPEGERFFNSALLIDSAGEIAAEYRKQRLFAYAREHEVYSAGGSPRVVEWGGLRIALFICFDLRFPELFREAAPFADAVVVIANWPVERQGHWEVLLRARAIESQTWVIGVNRIGEGGGLTYGGASAVYGPWGELHAAPAGGELSVVVIDSEAVTAARQKFPFVDDRRFQI
jgi:omega-amidase